jgi:hypothetical protein
VIYATRLNKGFPLAVPLNLGPLKRPSTIFRSHEIIVELTMSPPPWTPYTCLELHILAVHVVAVRRFDERRVGGDQVGRVRTRNAHPVPSGGATPPTPRSSEVESPQTGRGLPPCDPARQGGAQFRKALVKPARPCHHGWRPFAPACSSPPSVALAPARCGAFVGDGRSLPARKADRCTDESAPPWSRRSPRAFRFGTSAGATAAANRECCSHTHRA